MLESSGSMAVTPAVLRKFATTARRRLRQEGGGYRRDHLRAFAQRVEVGEGHVRIMGSKGELLRALTSVSSGKSAGIGMPTLGLKWRRRRDSNPRDLFGVCSFSKRVPSASRPRLRFPSYAEPEPVLQGIETCSTGETALKRQNVESWQHRKGHQPHNGRHAFMKS